jgi:hypothetical protein
MAKIDFNTWANNVQFGVKCDRLQYENFINNYENAKFIQSRTGENQENNESRNSLPIIDFRIALGNRIDFLFSNQKAGRQVKAISAK